MDKLRIKNIIRHFFGFVFPLLRRTIPNPNLYINCIEGKRGIEIGGPSQVFKDYDVLPLYKHIASLDCCNFSGSTVWEGSLNEGNNFNFYKGKTGFQFIKEAADLKGIQSESYDFLLSSHCLEHCSNAIKAIEEWKRVVKTNGYLLIIVPDKEHTFDHNRPLTTLNHFIEDFKNNIGEDDLSHMEEILKHHDLSMDKRAGTKEEFANRSILNIENRCLHHHTFSKDNLSQLINYTGLKIVQIEKKSPYHLICLAQKLSA